jgi:hypothetical protein
MFKAAILSAMLASGLVLAPTADALPTSGTFLVPSEIDYGTYRVVPTSPLGGYYAICGDYACEPGAGDSMITNDNVDGSGIMVIPTNAVSVEIQYLTVTRMQ